LNEGGAAFPTSVPRVVARMREIERSLPRGDGVACFVGLYRQVTEDVRDGLEKSTFANPRFLERLDLVFASLFFAAVDAEQRDPGSAPPAWRPLFAARSQRAIAPIQFALAGMNAHINRDLPLAVVATCGELGIELRAGTPEHADFLRINALLADVEAKLEKESYLPRWLRPFDRLLHRTRRLGDVIAMWNVERARDAAWTNAEALWALRREPELAAEFVASLDRLVGFAGRGLLIPSESFLGRATRWLRRR
jgi:Family of unknown function (DUF5995)